MSLRSSALEPRTSPWPAMFSSTIVTPFVSACARLMASATQPSAVGRSSFIAEPGLQR